MTSLPTRPGCYFCPFSYSNLTVTNPIAAESVSTTTEAGPTVGSLFSTFEISGKKERERTVSLRDQSKGSSNRISPMLSSLGLDRKIYSCAPVDTIARRAIAKPFACRAVVDGHVSLIVDLSNDRVFDEVLIDHYGVELKSRGFPSKRRRQGVPGSQACGLWKSESIRRRLVWPRHRLIFNEWFELATESPSLGIQNPDDPGAVGAT